MNWSTIAPETRLYKGKNLYRWELSPGVHHHCGTCATPLSNPHAKTTCLGVHVEPCYRFHQQLHFVGKSHECFGCNSSDEKHHQRHKEILKIVRQINVIDQVSLVIPESKFGGSTRSRRPSFTSVSSPTDTGSEDCVENEELRMTRRERKKAKKAGNGGTRDKKNLELFPKEEIDFISEAIHLFVHESKGAWEGTYVYTHLPAEIDSSAEAAEADDNEFESFSARMEALAVKTPETMTPRQRRINKRVTTPVSFSSYGGGSKKYTPRQDDDPYDGVDPDIFFRLHIDVVKPGNNNRARKDIIAKLVAAIKEDLEIIQKEKTESALREEGFWRWAGKQAYDQILQTRTELDWATGQKKGTQQVKSYEDRMADLQGDVEEAVEDEDFETALPNLDGEMENPLAQPTLDCETTPRTVPQTPTPKQSSKSKLPALNWDPPPRSSRRTVSSPGVPLMSPATPRTVTPRSAKIVEDDDEWTVVSNKKSSSSAAAKSRLTKSHRFFSEGHDTIPEEGEDMGEMLSRAKQRAAGDNNIGGARTLTPVKKGRTLSIKVSRKLSP